jgi:2-phosphosulfolactate phosphatase
MKIDLYLTPIPINKANLEQKTVAVVDVLRATTSVCAALIASARGVIPTEGPGEAVEMWQKIGSDMAVLAGERDGVKIENFQIGNSPLEFTEESVGGKLVVMTTTNGTPIFSQTTAAGLIIATALTNISTVAERVASEDKDLTIVCAGKDGGFSIEDTICGGMLVHLLATTHKSKLQLNDASSLALLLYRTNKTAIQQSIEQGEHGRFLTSIGFAKDVEVAAMVDSMPVLPVLRDGRLVNELVSA